MVPIIKVILAFCRGFFKILFECCKKTTFLFLQFLEHFVPRYFFLNLFRAWCEVVKSASERLFYSGFVDGLFSTVFPKVLSKLRM